MPWNMSGPIRAFATDTIAVSRPSVSYGANGRRVDGDPAPPVTLRACVQPASGKDLLRLPEGDMASEVLAVWVVGVVEVGDRLTIGGGAYEVQTVERWGPAGRYVKALARRGAR